MKYRGQDVNIISLLQCITIGCGFGGVLAYQYNQLMWVLFGIGWGFLSWFLVMKVRISKRNERTKKLQALITRMVSEELEHSSSKDSHVVLGIEPTRNFGMSERPMNLLFAIKSYKGIKHRGKSQPSAIDSLVSNVFSLEFNPSKEFEEYLTPNDFDVLETLMNSVRDFLKNKALDFKVETLDTEEREND